MAAISNRESFHAEARYQAVCAACGRAGPFHAHHVVDKGWLKRHGLPENDTRNALRLCVKCHMQHEWGGPGKVEIEMTKLPPDSLCYAFEVMGMAAGVWLRRHYIGEDPRVDAHEEGACACQVPAR